MNKNIKRIGKISLKALLLIALTEVIALVSRLLFVENLFGEEYFSERVMNIGYTVFFILIFNSLVIAIASHDYTAKDKYLAQAGKGKFLPIAKFVLTSIEYYIEIACITLVSLILPTSFLYGFVAKAFFGSAELTDIKVKLYTLLIILPLMFVIDFLARVTVAKKWYQDSRKVGADSEHGKKKKIPPALKSVGIVAIVYCAASLVVPWTLPFFISIYNIGGGLGYLWIFLILVTLAFITFISFYIRAIFKRKRFIKKLRKYCADNSVRISEINRPYRSIFRLKAGYDFSIEKEGIEYDCKLLAGVFPGSPMVLSDKGNGLTQITVRVFRAELFHILSKFDFAFESKGKKILIVTPAPKRMFSSTHGEPPRLADTGEKIGEYTFCTARGFLGSIDRNCL